MSISRQKQKESSKYAFYEVMKKSKHLSFAGKWMELSIIVLSKISKMKKENTEYLILYI